MADKPALQRDSGTSAADSAVRVAVVLDCLRGVITPRDAALRAAVSEDHVQRWIDQFIQGGTNALAHAAEDTSAELATLNAVNQALSAILDVNELLHEAVSTLRLLFGYYLCVGLIENEMLVVRHGYNGDGSALARPSFAIPLNGSNPLAWCAANGRLLYVPDTSANSQYSLEPCPSAARSFVALPIIFKGNALGALIASSDGESRFSHRDTSILETIAFQLAAAVENALLFDQVDRRIKQLEASRSIASRAIAAEDFQSLINYGARVTRDVLEYATVCIGIIDQPGDTIALTMANGDGLHTETHPLPLESGTPMMKILERNTPQQVHHFSQQDSDTAVPVMPNAESAMGVPLRADGKHAGVLYVESAAPHAFDTTDLTTLRLIADQLSSAIRGINLFEQTQRQLNEIRLFRRLADESIVGIITRDADGLIDFANQAVVDLLGAGSPDNVIGRRMGDFGVSNAWYTDDQQICEVALQTGGWSGEVPLMRADQRQIDVEMAVFPIYTSDGIFSKFGTVFQDITERRALMQAVEQMNSRFQALFEASEDGMIVWDDRWRVLMINPRAADTLRVPGDFLIGLHRSNARIVPAFEVLMTAAPDERVMLESRRVVRCRHIPWHAADVAGYLTMIYDETTRVELEKYREDMIKMLVHDLRSPLNSVTMGLDLTESALIDEQDPVEALAALNAAKRGLRRVMTVADDLLDIAKLEAGQMQLRCETMDSRSLLQEVASTLDSTAERAHIDVMIATSDELPQIGADVNLVRRAVTNLYDNALKFSPDHGKVILAATFNGQGVTFSVTDSGPGVPEPHRAKIFNKYHQVPQSGGRRKGTGLGLALCRLVAEAHQGRVWVESRPEGGSIFFLTINQCGK